MPFGYTHINIWSTPVNGKWFESLFSSEIPLDFNHSNVNVRSTINNNNKNEKKNVTSSFSKHHDALEKSTQTNWYNSEFYFFFHFSLFAFIVCCYSFRNWFSKQHNTNERKIRTKNRNIEQINKYCMRLKSNCIQ